MEKQKIELLAPAGSFEALKAAVSNGADAVYFGGGKFNARINAGNFTNQELVDALDYAHERGVKSYLTLNTLLKNNELAEALDFAGFAYKYGIDAIIVQDLGLLNLVRKEIPDLAVHASTQMTVTNASSVNALEKLGVRRVVLSRELSLSEIKGISVMSSLELEVFVHGALCVSYSGQCLMSSFIGGRSGNRGTCAQPCRLPWSHSPDGKSFGKDSYLISPRDLMAVELLPQLQDAGAASLKLEGRMKSPEYVAIAVSVYRKYLDMLYACGQNGYKVDEVDIARLMQAFNRGGFTQSYLKGERDYKKLIYTKHPKNQGIYIGDTTKSRPLYVEVKLEESLGMGDGIEIMDEEQEPHSMIVTSIVQNGKQIKFADKGSTVWVGDIKTAVKKGSLVYKTLSKSMFEQARQTYERGEAALVPLSLELCLKVGQPVKLLAYDYDGNKAVAESEQIAEKALNKGISLERIEEQLRKTGGTPYFIKELKFDTDEASTVPVSVLNALRRSVLDDIKKSRIKRNTIADGYTYEQSTSEYNPGNEPSLSASFLEIPTSLDVLNGLVERIYIPITEKEHLKRARRQFEGELFILIPPIIKDTELRNIKNTLVEAEELFDGIAYGNLGVIGDLKEVFPDKSFSAEHSMNLFNDEAVSVQKALGASGGALSPELRMSEVSEFKNRSLMLEAIVYGRIQLMTMEHCPSQEKGCSGLCISCNKRRGFLKDRKGEIFPYIRNLDLKRTQVYNAYPVFMDDIDLLKKAPLSFLRLMFTTENQDVVEAVVRYYSHKLNGTGILSSAERSIMADLEKRGFTKGHWFRGV